MIREKLIEAYRKCKTYERGVLLSQLGAEAKIDLGGRKLIEIIRSLPDLFNILEDRDSDVVRHFIKLLPESTISCTPIARGQSGLILELKMDKKFGFIRENETNIKRLFYFSEVISQLDLSFICNLDGPISVSYQLKKDPKGGDDLASGVSCEAIGYETRRRMSLNLREWCYIHEQDSVLADLSQISLNEEWTFPGSSYKFDILINYLRHTFEKLQMEKMDQCIKYRDINIVNDIKDLNDTGVGYSDDYKLAAFNTGLVNYSYEPILAVFEENNRKQQQPYKFKGFCIRGEQPLGKQVQKEIFATFNRAIYFSEISDCIYLDPRVPVQCSWEHIIIDGIEKERFPNSFLLDYCRNELRELSIDKKCLDKDDLKRLSDIIRNDRDKRTYNVIKGRMESALRLAQKRVEWNFKTAIPTWYPKERKINLLLPLALVDDNAPDVALVVEQIRQKDSKNGLKINYTAHTIFTLRMAYNNSRLVCRPDSDWLTPQKAAIGPA